MSTLKLPEKIYDAIILGAGASGLMAAIHAAGRGRKVLVIDHAPRAGKKLLVSGGGKCNITNRHISFTDYFGADNTFCQQALKRFTTNSTLRILKQAGIETEERAYGRIFCKKSADEIVSYLYAASKNAGACFLFHTEVTEVLYTTHFQVICEGKRLESANLLIATGGLACPQVGATDLGYRIARQFGHRIMPLRPALTGFILPHDSPLRNLQGISLEVWLQVKGKDPVIAEPLLFTHKGISGPSVFQASCFREKGEVVSINFLPSEDVVSHMHDPSNGRLLVKNLIARFLSGRLVEAIIPDDLSDRKVAGLSKKERQRIAGCVHSYAVCPDALEGFSKAEATLGGVSTGEINPGNMESLLLKGLFFSGEVIDITGKLGGYNIHWAFASGYVAGQTI